jgi:PGF-CTERM protein
MKTWIMITVALLALVPTAFAQNPIDAVAGPVQEKMNTAGQQLQQKAVQHIVEGNVTPEHLSQDLNANKQNLTAQAKKKLNQELDANLNLTSEQLQQKATEELKKQVIQQVPGFETLIALIGLLGVALVIGRKD